jgi:hypothetical protein
MTCVPKMNHDVCRGSFFPFFARSIPLTAVPKATIPNDTANPHHGTPTPAYRASGYSLPRTHRLTTQRSPQPPSPQPIDNTDHLSTTSSVQQRQITPVVETYSPSTKNTAHRRNIQPIDETYSPSAKHTTHRRHVHPNNDTYSPSAGGGSPELGDMCYIMTGWVRRRPDGFDGDKNPIQRQT